MEFTKDLDSIKSMLSPGACYSPKTLRSFLQLSRKHSDDALPTAVPRTGSCASHVSKTIFPAWFCRDYILEYCDDVANKKDTISTDDNSSSATQEEPPIDPRFDPYGARDFGKKDSSPEDSVKSWIERERMVEDIIRDDSVKFLAAKCGPILIPTSPTSTRLATSPESYKTAYDTFKDIYKGDSTSYP